MRIECPRADVPSDVARAYALLAQPNDNPAIERVDRVDDHGVATALVPEGGAGDEVVHGGDVITLSLTVTPDAAEQYARISADGRSVERATETLDVSWFAAGGRFESNRTVASGSRARNVVHVDAGRASPVTLWVVARDGRGGTDWRVFRWTVQ